MNKSGHTAVTPPLFISQKKPTSPIPTPLLRILTPCNSGGDWKLGGMDLLSRLGGTDYSIAERRGLQPRQFQSAERNNDDWWRYSVRWGRRRLYVQHRACVWS